MVQLGEKSTAGLKGQSANFILVRSECLVQENRSPPFLEYTSLLYLKGSVLKGK